MLKSILSVIAGYATFSIVVLAGFSIALVYPQVAFQPDSLFTVPLVGVAGVLLSGRRSTHRID